MILIVEQVYIFLYAILAGAIAAFLYDILRIKRRAIKTSVIFVSLEDILYWLIAAVLLFITVYNSNSGEMRGYIFIGNVIGVVLYESLLSSLIIKSSMMIINIIKKIFKFIWKVFSYPFKLAYKIIKVPIMFVFRLFNRLFRLVGRGMVLSYKKADVKGKALRIKSNAGSFTKKSIRKLKERNKKTNQNDNDSNEEPVKVKGKKKKIKEKKPQTNEVKNNRKEKHDKKKQPAARK